MARYTESVCRLCRRENLKMYLKGDRCYTDKCAIERRPYPPGQHGQGRTKFSEYGVQLREKQKVKRMYGLLEAGSSATPTRTPPPRRARPARTCSRRSSAGSTTSSSASASPTPRNEARQLVRHGHFRVNGRKVEHPELPVPRAGDVVELEGPLEEGRPHQRGARGGRPPRRPGLARARQGRLQGHREDRARARGHHDADPGAAHRRALLEVALREARAAAGSPAARGRKRAGRGSAGPHSFESVARPTVPRPHG